MKLRQGACQDFDGGYTCRVMQWSDHSPVRSITFCTTRITMILSKSTSYLSEDRKRSTAMRFGIPGR